MRKRFHLKEYIVLGVIFVFFFNGLGQIPLAQGQEFILPAPGTMVTLSPAYSPAVLKGIKLDTKDPFKFHFYVDTGDSLASGRHPERSEGSQQEQLKQESSRLIKYFLASLTIPEQDLWVNLSPYEKDRIVPKELGQTEMGRDLLAQDYILKQLTASLIYPESKLGKEFWAKIYAQAQTQYGTTNIPVNTFNKVWIVPDKAVVYENNGTAFVLENHLKVLLEEDYLSLQKHRLPSAPLSDFHSVGANIIRQIVIPALTKEVNEGQNFAQLRQVFYSLILATWYKKKIKDGILAQLYENRKKTEGLGSVSLTPREIYNQYLQAFKKGVFNYIKETDGAEGVSVPRKYFSGGVVGSVIPQLIDIKGPGQVDPAQLNALIKGPIVDIAGNMRMISLSPVLSGDKAMSAQQLKVLSSLRNVSLHMVRAYFDWEKQFPENDELVKQLHHSFMPVLSEISTKIFSGSIESYYQKINERLEGAEHYLSLLSNQNIAQAKFDAREFLRENEIATPHEQTRAKLFNAVQSIILRDDFNIEMAEKIRQFKDVFIEYSRAISQRIDQLEALRRELEPSITDDRIVPETRIELRGDFDQSLNRFLWVMKDFCNYLEQRRAADPQLSQEPEISDYLDKYRIPVSESESLNSAAHRFEADREQELLTLFRSFYLAATGSDLSGITTKTEQARKSVGRTVARNLENVERLINFMEKQNHLRLYGETTFGNLADQLITLNRSDARQFLRWFLRAMQVYYPAISIRFINDAAMGSKSFSDSAMLALDYRHFIDILKEKPGEIVVPFDLTDSSGHRWPARATYMSMHRGLYWLNIRADHASKDLFSCQYSSEPSVVGGLKVQSVMIDLEQGELPQGKGLGKQLYQKLFENIPLILSAIKNKETLEDLKSFIEQKQHPAHSVLGNSKIARLLPRGYLYVWPQEKGIGLDAYQFNAFGMFGDVLRDLFSKALSAERAWNPDAKILFALTDEDIATARSAFLDVEAVKDLLKRFTELRGVIAAKSSLFQQKNLVFAMDEQIARLNELAAISGQWISVKRIVTVKNTRGIHALPSSIISRVGGHIEKEAGIKLYMISEKNKEKASASDRFALMFLGLGNTEKAELVAVGERKKISEKKLQAALDIMERLLQDENTLEDRSNIRNYYELINALAEYTDRAMSSIENLSLFFDTDGEGVWGFFRQTKDGQSAVKEMGLRPVTGKDMSLEINERRTEFSRWDRIPQYVTFKSDETLRYAYEVYLEKNKAIGNVFAVVNEARKEILIKWIDIDPRLWEEGYSGPVLALLKARMLKDGYEGYQVKAKFHQLSASGARSRKSFENTFGKPVAEKNPEFGPDELMFILKGRYGELEGPKTSFNEGIGAKGGIDLNPAQLNMSVKQEGEDFKFNFNGTEMDAAQVTGVTFTIRTMTPMTDLPQILGIK